MLTTNPYSTPHMLHVSEPVVIERADTRTKTIAPSLKRLGYNRKQRETIIQYKLELRAERKASL